MSRVSCPSKIINLYRPTGKFSMKPSQPPIPASKVNSKISTAALMHGGNTIIEPDLNTPHPDATTAAAGVKQFVKIDGESLLSDQDLQMINNELVNSIDAKCKTYTSSLKPKIAGSGGGRRKNRRKSRRKYRRKSRRKNRRKSRRSIK